MIVVTRLNGTQVVVNAELIELIESTPDTLVSLSTGNKINVREPVAVVMERVLTYRRLCHPESRSLASNARSAVAALGLPGAAEVPPDPAANPTESAVREG